MQLSITEYLWRWTAAVLCGAALTFTMPMAATAQEQLPPGYRAYRLRHREADELAPQLRKMLSGLKGDSQVLVDQEANRLVVRGDDQAQQLAAQLVGALDQASRSGNSNSPAGAPPSANVIRAYPTPDQDPQAIAASLRSHFPTARIEADARTGQIVVAAAENVQQQIADALGAEGSAPGLDRNTMPVPPSSEFRPTYQLRHISWREFEDQLRSLWGTQLSLVTARNGELATLSLAAEAEAQPILHIDRRLDLVTFEGTAESARLWRTIVQTLDSVPQANHETAVIRLQKADPQQVKHAVSLIQATQPRDGSQVVAAVPLHRGDRSRRGNTLVSMLFQPNGQAADAQAPPAANDQPAPPGQAQPATEPQASEAIQLGGEPAGEQGAGLIGPVQIEFVEGTDTIIIKGHTDDVARVKKMIEDIERIATTTKPIFEVYPLLHINSEAAATIAEEVYTEILSTRQGTVSIRPLVEPNSILLIGRQESVDDVKGLLGKLDQPTDTTAGFEVFRLKHMAAAAAETVVRNFFVDQPGTAATGAAATTGNSRPGLGTRARVIADTRTNSLIVQASPRDLGEVRRLIDSLDVLEGEHTSQVRVFKLKNAMAEDLATVLQSAISGQAQAGAQGQGQGQGFQQPFQPTGTQGTSGQASGALEFMLIDQDGGKLLRSGILADVLVTGDVNTNSLIVTAPAKSMELIAALIQQLDQLPDAEAQIKVFTIINGDATSLAAMLQQLFGQQVTAGQGTTGGLFGGLTFNQFQVQTTTGAGGESSLIPLRFAIDTRTNSIIASGSQNDLTVVETLLLRLDEGDVDQRQLVVVRLKNAPAQDVANSITTLLTTQRTVIQQQLLSNQAISAYEQIDREVIVVPEIVTNSLIVSATSRYFDEVMRVIQELDFRPPMVMVQVVIAEVGLNNTFEFGTEFGLQDSLLYDRGIAGTASDPGFNFNDANVGVDGPGLPNRSNAGRGTVANQALSNFLVGRTSGLGFGGLVLSGASDSFNYLLRAMEVEGKAQILSRPQIMTLNNQPAFVQVGADVPRIQGATNTNAGVTNDIEDTPTGLILRIQPLINDDGVIVMTLDAERSFLDTGAVPVDIGNGAEAFPIRRTTAQTTVSAKSGQTVVFAGLITMERTTQLRKVPYVSDIPVLGHLFQYKQDFDERRELLIVMTPFIVRDDEDYEMIKMMESERMSWCLGNVVAIHGEVGLGGGSCMFCDTSVPTLFPDDNPTGLETFPDGQPELAQGHDHSSPAEQEAPAMQMAPLPERPATLQPVQTTHIGTSPHQPVYGPPPATAPMMPRMVQPVDYHNAAGATAQPIPNRLPMPR